MHILINRFHKKKLIHTIKTIIDVTTFSSKIYEKSLKLCVDLVNLIDRTAYSNLRYTGYSKLLHYF